jgi:magnesium-transporting ATPase (P-type)
MGDVEMARAGDEGPKIHELPIEDVITDLGTDGENGISKEEAAKRLEEDGPNELESPPRLSLFVLFLLQLNSVIMYLLMMAVVASAAIKATGDDSGNILSYVDSIAITIIILINATIAAVTENNANDALEALSSLQSPMSTVIRGGEEVQIESRDMVRGDLVKLGTGDVVPADVRLVKANDLRVNEMLLTGEPEDVAKTSKVKERVAGAAEKLTADNMAFSSCNVKAGSAMGIVVATGMRTRVGSIAALLNKKREDDIVDEVPDDASVESVESIDTDTPMPPKAQRPSLTKDGEIVGIIKEKTPLDKFCDMFTCSPKGTVCFGTLPDPHSEWTPLQHNLEDLAIKIGYIAIFVCVLVFIVGVAMGTQDPEDQDTPSWLFMILVAVTLTVAAIPEGLPLCVTIALSEGSKSMVENNVLMRKIAAVETLGSASIICTDKTGTLTEGKMTLVAMYAGDMDFKVDGKGFDPTVGGITVQSSGANAADKGGVKAILGSAVLCSNTSLKLEEDEETKEMKWTPRGNSSEAPLVVGAHKIGIKFDELEASNERVYEIPFSSSRKMMVTVTKTVGPSVLSHVSGVGQFTGHIKGAPNYIMEKCTQYMDADGNVRSLDAATKARYMAKVDELSSRALRVLAVATKNFYSLPYNEDQETDVKFEKICYGLTLCGLCASIDPERDGVKEAVADSRTAGVRVVMITGDYLKTAVAIAKNISILDPETYVEGNGEATDCVSLRPEGPYINHKDIDKLTRRTSVFARAKPEDKLEIVKSLQRQGWVSAMTGDGVNDAPALQRADIGVAMGKEGTEVAKGASDMILTDDNFCSIVKAIEKGRIIYAGIQKFVSFIMSVHFAEVLQIFLCIVSSIPVMRKPLQILFLIIVTDLPPSIALGFEPGEKKIMRRKPRPKTQPVVMPWMWRGIVANGLIITVCIFCTYLLALWAYAGAFDADDIIDPTRTSCTIWEPHAMTPTLDINCAVTQTCSSTPGAANYHADCVGGSVTIPHGNSDCDICIEESIRRARTVAFIALVWAEGFRAYTSRSFDVPVWKNPFNNPTMNWAVLFAELTLVCALFIPGFNMVLDLYVYEIHSWGFFLAFMGSFSCLILCEVYKYFTRHAINQTSMGESVEEDGYENVTTEEVSVEIN